MNFNIGGTFLKKDTKTKIWWAKVAVALIISNLFFFLLFAGEKETAPVAGELPEGWVELQIEAQLLTPFIQGKRVLLIQRQAARQVSAILKHEQDASGKLTLLVEENQAPLLIQYQNWEILPFLKNMIFKTRTQGIQHEIRY